MSSTASWPVSTISWKARLNRKSPTSTLGLLPQTMIGGDLAPAQRAFVHHIVVQQGGGVDELHGGGELDVTVALIAAHLGGGEGQQRPQALAAGIDQMACQIGNQIDGAAHAARESARRSPACPLPPGRAAARRAKRPFP